MKIVGKKDFAEMQELRVKLVEKDKKDHVRFEIFKVCELLFVFLLGERRCDI